MGFCILVWKDLNKLLLLNMMFWTIIFSILQSLVVIILVLISVAFFTLGERKVMAAIQGRRGPNDVGYLGLLQALADGLKLFCKEIIFPSGINKLLYSLAPWLAFVLSIMGWAVIPFDEGVVISNMSLGVLYTLAVSSLSVYAILLAGWSSNSKYAFLGAIRSVAQMISYEVSVGFIIISVCLCAGSLNLSKIVFAQENVFYFIPLFPLFLIFLVSILAETNRHPFDLAEAESELVSGFNVEYSGMPFALFFLAEYSNMLLMGAVTSTLFIGGWLAPNILLSFLFIPGAFWLAIKISIIAVMFCAVRAVLPRYRYDQLMMLGWKGFLPVVLGILILVSSILMSFNFLI
jgi:NADH-quinone oxidoreductase subunit H